jgi:hypothetical protein
MKQLLALFLLAGAVASAQTYPFGQAHTFAGVDYVVDWMHEQDIIPV